MVWHISPNVNILCYINLYYNEGMEKFFEKYHSGLFKCTKPYQYVGGEFLSYNKDFDSANVHFAFCFPDKYEIGISNLGVRILYDLVNKHEGFMCDRAYAPEPDFKPEILYGLESKHPIRDFDAVGFSLQYEMAYPTVLKMLDMAKIPYRNDMRSDDDPIVMAGGPCAFNPLPLADFIDVFMIGDGEDTIIEVCKILEDTKGLPREERIKALCKDENSGRWSKLTGGKVKKRIAQLTYDTALKSYPIPYSSSVQDRAVVEIRRGCGRMCRFCQPGHVTLPIRERESEEIVKITKELVKNTGYDEYSLLSLSSNDYANINEVIKELSIDFNKKKVSVSLPSQRIDGFNLELANLVQSVRKSTMTLAPEAGSQRLRDVIKKNITEDMIIDAVAALYENGWSRVKFYFICGLPTETIHDMDEMAELFRKIRYRCIGIKREKGLKHSMDITCTLSIFVPKPFTPFQWCPQMDLGIVTEHIRYLKEQIKNIKGVKINYHEQVVSMIEAVLTRGDDNLCKYIEALFKKGCYLDAWGEYFDEDIWLSTAADMNINLTELAQKEYLREEILPWDFIDVGINKNWFITEYNDAFKPENLPDSEVKNECHIVPTCQTKCVNCGVCSNLKTRKVLAKPFKASDKYKPEVKRDPTDGNQQNVKPVYKYRLKITKSGILRYFSHLDWQNTFLKALSRSGLKVAFSQGFNPTMKVSLGIALPLFAQSEGELVDIDLWEDVDVNTVRDKLQAVLPPECKIISIVKKNKDAQSIDNTATWAEYRIDVFNSKLYDFENLKYNTDRVLSSDEIYIEKKNKKGLTKKINIKPAIKSYRFEGNSLFIVLKTGQGSDIPALRADVLMSLIEPDTVFDITRTGFFDEELREL